LIPAQLRVALVHDFLVDVRGAERVFMELCRLWPQADIFTTIYDEDGTEGWFAGRTIYTSFLQRLRPTARNFRRLLPLYPAAVESFDLSGYDLVISSSSAWAHAVVCDEHTPHISYCHNPFRYAWNDRERTLAGRDPLSRGFLRALFHRWRQWDWIAAQRVDSYLANSATTQARIQAYFGRDARVVHPPVETGRFEPGVVGEHYVVVSELMPHKEIGLAIAAFNALKLPLIVIGDGPDARRLRRAAGPTIRFAGRQPDLLVAQVLQGARALVVTSIEEFGIAAVESQAAGRPVIARRGGGALETVVEGVTGCLWEGGVEELTAAVAGFDDAAVDPQACVENAARFDAARFRGEVLAEVDAVGSGEREARRPSRGERALQRRARLVRRGAREAGR
jgi:glycosyltransferase involved in cell wall biosynthesis